MTKQINLDAWQIQHLLILLKLGSSVAKKTGRPIVLYRQIIEEEDGCYEELVCTLSSEYVIEQVIASGGVLAPSFGQQEVFTISEYPHILLNKSKDRFLDVTSLLEEQLDQVGAVSS